MKDIIELLLSKKRLLSSSLQFCLHLQENQLEMSGRAGTRSGKAFAEDDKTKGASQWKKADKSTPAEESETRSKSKVEQTQLDQQAETRKQSASKHAEN